MRMLMSNVLNVDADADFTANLTLTVTVMPTVTLRLIITPTLPVIGFPKPGSFCKTDFSVL